MRLYDVAYINIIIFNNYSNKTNSTSSSTSTPSRMTSIDLFWHMKMVYKFSLGICQTYRIVFDLVDYFCNEKNSLGWIRYYIHLIYWSDTEASITLNRNMSSARIEMTVGFCVAGCFFFVDSYQLMLAQTVYRISSFSRFGYWIAQN